MYSFSCFQSLCDLHKEHPLTQKNSVSVNTFGQQKILIGKTFVEGWDKMTNWQTDIQGNQQNAS